MATLAPCWSESAADSQIANHFRIEGDFEYNPFPRFARSHHLWSDFRGRYSGLRLCNGACDCSIEPDSDRGLDDWHYATAIRDSREKRYCDLSGCQKAS